MLGTVKIASLKIYGDSRSEVEVKVGRKVAQICSTKTLDKTKMLHCNVEWLYNTDSANFAAMISIYYTFDDSDVEKNHCEVCRDTHNLFYCNRQYNCNQCAFAAYRSRREEKYKEMKRAGRYVLNKDMYKEK